MKEKFQVAHTLDSSRKDNSVFSKVFDLHHVNESENGNWRSWNNISDEMIRTRHLIGIHKFHPTSDTWNVNRNLIIETNKVGVHSN